MGDSRDVQRARISHCADPRCGAVHRLGAGPADRPWWPGIASRRWRPRRTGAGTGNPAVRPRHHKNAKTGEGIFTVHRIKDRVYYEIPKERLGREFLWVSQIAKRRSGPDTAARRREIASSNGNGVERGFCFARFRTTSSPTPARRSRSTTEFDDDSVFDETRANDVCWPDYAVKPRRGAR